MAKTITQADVARKFREKYGWEMPTAQLARIMYKQNKITFNDAEHARTALRRIEGKCKGGVTVSKEAPKEARPLNPHKLPESWGKPKGSFKLPIACNRVGFMCDQQIPFHDNEAIICLVEWFKKKNVNTIFINGDLVDFYGISFYEKDPKERKFIEEIDATRAFLRWLRAEFPDATIYYNMNSNHEIRWEKFLIRKAIEIFDMPEFQLENILRLNEFKIIPLKGYDHCKIGKLAVLHGHTIFGRFGNSVSKAKTVFDKMKHSCIASHVHITDEYNTKDHITGKMFTCWTVGCLMNLNIEYNPHGNQYNHGGAYIETDNQGNYSVENKRIFNGKIL